MKVLDLFSGIGGFSLGLERAGMETVAFCEIEDYPRKVLAKHWPSIPIYDDVRTLTGDRLRQDGIGTVDVITGGFPCQDISAAGNQAGIGEGTRSGLWSECARLLGDIRPRYAIFENVTALISGDNGRWFEQVLWDISQVGYDAEWHCIPASELGAHHHRDRVWIIAYPNGSIGGYEPVDARENTKRGIPNDVVPLCQDLADTTLSDVADSPGGKQSVHLDRGKPERGEKTPSERAECVSGRGSLAASIPNPNSEGLQGLLTRRALQKWHQTTGYSGQGSESPGWSWASEPSVGRVANGIPQRSHRLKGLGNAICPPMSELIGRAIMEAEA